MAGCICAGRITCIASASRRIREPRINTDETRIKANNVCSADEGSDVDCDPARTAPPMTAARLTAAMMALALFIASCEMSAVHGHGGVLKDGVELLGWDLLGFGWMKPPPVPGLANLACWACWLANPLFVLALVALLRQQFRKASVFSSLGMGIGLTPIVILSWNHVEFHLAAPIRIVSYGGPQYFELRLGYMLWLYSHTTLFLSALLLWRHCRQAE